MSNVSKIHDMEPDFVFALVRQHGIRGTCKILQVGTHALQRFLKLHNFDNTPPWTKKHVLQHYIANGFSAPEIAVELGCVSDTVYTWLHKFDLILNYKPWTAQEEKYLLFMAFQEPWPVIAEKLGRTIAAVQIRTKKLGIRSSAMIGYCVEDIANDTHMTREQVRVWYQQLGLKSSLVQSTRNVTVNPVDFYEWLIAGNIFRIEDISKCAHWLKEIHANAMQEYISNKEINFYAPKVMDYAARQPWPNRVVPHPIIHIQRNGIGNLYNRDAVREWLKYYRYVLPRKITPQMPNYLWWRDFVNEWDHHYIYRNEIMHMIGDYDSKLGHLQKAHGFPKSTCSIHGYFVRSEITSWCRTTGMYTEWLKHL